MRFCLSVCLLPSPCRWTCKAGSNFPCDRVVYLDSRCRRQWNSMVLSSEASMAGWGRTGAFWPREVVSSVGHTSERSRFSRWEGPNARDHAFQVAFPEPVDPCTKYLRSPQEDAPKELWLEDPNFRRCSVFVANALGTKWSRDMGAQGRHPCAGVRSAPQSPLAGLSLFSRNLSGAIVFGGQHECCTGIRTTTGSCAPPVGLHPALRCRDVFATVRWIPSGFNTSDAESRKYDPFYDASQSVLARLEEKCRRTATHRPSPHSSQDSCHSQDAALNPSSHR